MKSCEFESGYKDINQQPHDEADVELFTKYNTKKVVYL